MNKSDAEEAAGIVQRCLATLVSSVAATGRAGSNLRSVSARTSANAQALLQADAAGQPLVDCFDLAVTAGATQPQLGAVRNSVLAEAPVTLGATLTKNNLVRLCLATEGVVIADVTFTSRADVEKLQAQLNTVFSAVVETAADEMAQASFQAVVALHAATNGFLTSEARPLPRLVRYAFARSQPSLVMGHRLYADAGRADALRKENKIVHPAFMQSTGRALSA